MNAGIKLEGKARRRQPDIETPIALGLEKRGDVVEIFSSGDGATWTMVFTRPDGETCLVASGEAWQAIPVKVRGPDA